MSSRDNSDTGGGCIVILLVLLIIALAIVGGLVSSATHTRLQNKYVSLRLEVFSQKMQELEDEGGTNTKPVFSDLGEVVEYATVTTEPKVEEALTRMERYLAGRPRYNKEDWARLNDLKVEFHDMFDDEDSR